MKLSRREVLALLGKTGAMASVSWGNAATLFAGGKPQQNGAGVVEDFPDMTTDKQGKQWLVVLEREVPGRSISVYMVENGSRKMACRYRSESITGVAAPAITPLASGCLVAFPVEKDDRWQIVFAYVESGNEQNTVFKTIDSPGNSNIAPAVAVHGKEATVVWESNQGESRGIYSTTLRSEKPGSIQRLSSPDFNSYNPSVIALPDGRLFAAWDSFKESGSHIRGAWFIKGKWQKEKQLTSDPRIERYPFLATRGNELWMTWQAQSYAAGNERSIAMGKPPLGLNYVDEQRIVVAHVTEDGLRTPIDMFQKVSTVSEDHLKTPGGANLLMRPRIAFDGVGRLWLTARQSIHTNAGWLPLLWKYSGNRWEGPHVIHEEQGRWRPVPVSFREDGGSVASQIDDLPPTWDHTRGVYRDWQSEVELNKPDHFQEDTQETMVTEPLEMPGTHFSLKERMDLCSARLPEKKSAVGGKELTLYFGELHDHSDLSVCQRAQNPPGKDLYANVRDIEQLDFCAITDHGYNFDPAQWQLNGEQTRNNYDPGRFVTFLAEEWTSSNSETAGGYGHHNIIFLDPYHRTFYDAFDGNISPTDLWEQMKEIESITIPHQLADWKHKGKGNPPKDWAFHHEKQMPVAEIWQTRQSYEYLGCPRQAPDGMTIKGHYMQDAWDKGLIIGVIASPDHGGGHGKVGVWSEELTRESLFEAIRARHTFGTSGAKMELLLRSGDAIMGDKVKADHHPMEFEVKASALRDIEEVVIFRNNEIVFQEKPGTKSVQLSWKDKAPLDNPHVWYYARIHAADNQLAWSSPIWFLDMA